MIEAADLIVGRILNIKLLIFDFALTKHLAQGLNSIEQPFFRRGLDNDALAVAKEGI